MDRFVFEDCFELAEMMADDLADGVSTSAAVCHYEYAIDLIKELIRSGFSILSIRIWDYEYSNYDKEYQVCITPDGIICEPLYSESNEDYLDSVADVFYVHQDCNCQVLKHLETSHMFEMAIKSIDGDDADYDYGCDSCPCNFHNESVNVSMGENGKPDGFTKSWHSEKDGFSQYSSFSYFCNDEKMLKDFAQRFDIEL